MKMRSLRVLAAGLALFAAPACAETAPSGEAASTGFRTISAVDAAALLTTDHSVIVLDIRTEKEYAEGHIDGALNIDFRAADFEDNLSMQGRDRTYIVHCHSGGRSGKSMKLFRRLGFTDIIHLKSGIAGWRRAGLPEVTAGIAAE